MDRLHPRLRSLLDDAGWDALSPVQDAAWEPVSDGGHVLLMAPTGTGKTEAALLPVFDRLLRERDALEAAGRAWPPGFKALYITPLRALNRDLMGRLEAWAKALHFGIGVRHGDTSQAERARQSRSPPDVLITTPETVQLLLYGDRLRGHLRTVRFVIVDEAHDLAASERGAQLAVALERIEQVIAHPATGDVPAKERACPDPATVDGSRSGFQRIGLSATVADPDVVAGFLSGPAREAAAVRVAHDKRIEIDVGQADPSEADHAAAAQVAAPPAIMAWIRAVRDIVDRSERVLVFANTRDTAEMMASRHDMLGDSAQRWGLHHGSLHSDHRADVEDAFKGGELDCLIATSSLELGIDIGAIDRVVQLGSPHSVARMVQRAGRAGHRLGAVSHATMLASGDEDAIECRAIQQAAVAGDLEPLRLRESPVVVLANQLVALSNEYQNLDPEWTRRVFAASAPFADLDAGLFDAAWSALLELQTLFESDAAPGRISRSGRGRRQFLQHIGMIPDETTYRIFDEAAKRSVGSVDESFVAAGLERGGALVMAGRTWQVLDIDAESHRVRVAPAKDLGAVPQWAGQRLPVSFHVARGAAALRGTIEDGPGAALIERQRDDDLIVPTDRTLTLEASGRQVTAMVALGTAGNEALARITQALLQQRVGDGPAIGVDSDAYRIVFTLPPELRGAELETLWRELDPDTLDLLVAALLRDSPLLRSHLVYVAKQFGALPPQLDPNRFSRAKSDELLSHVALAEEAMDRLVADRFDLDAVAWILTGLRDATIQIVHQAAGPISRAGRLGARIQIAPRSDEKLLAQVRSRLESSDVLMLCTGCRRTWDGKAGDRDLPIRCRACGSIHVACLRPWNEDARRLLGAGKRTADEEKERKRIVRNAGLVAGFGRTACLALVGRGVGATAAARILERSSGPDSPTFWRLILQAELDFARTSAFW